MQKENGKRESPYKGILKFADEKKPQLSFAVVLSVLSSAFGIVPYIAVAILLQKALANSLTTTWAILLPVIALCGYLLKHTLYAKSTLCSHKVAYEIIKNIRTSIMKRCPGYLWERFRADLPVSLSSLSSTMRNDWKDLYTRSRVR